MKLIYPLIPLYYGPLFLVAVILKTFRVEVVGLHSISGVFLKTFWLLAIIAAYLNPSILWPLIISIGAAGIACHMSY